MSSAPARQPTIPYTGNILPASSSSSSTSTSSSSSSSSSSSPSSSSSSYSASDPDLPSSDTMNSTTVRQSVDSTSRPTVHVAVIRCLRCARAEEITSTDDPSLFGMVQIGTNIYYCNRCAKMVGYT
ncbi:hypothetical protein L209DRAFT_761315 [Thermothelomyces heterothallicus CBS 203.75]